MVVLWWIWKCYWLMMGWWCFGYRFNLFCVIKWIIKCVLCKVRYLFRDWVCLNLLCWLWIISLISIFIFVGKCCVSCGGCWLVLSVMNMIWWVIIGWLLIVVVIWWWLVVFILFLIVRGRYVIWWWKLIVVLKVWGFWFWLFWSF